MKIMQKKSLDREIPDFETLVRQKMNGNYKKLTRDEKSTIKEMSKFQQMGGEVGKRPLKE